MKNMQTPSQRFIAVRLDTTGSFDRNLYDKNVLNNNLFFQKKYLFEVVKKFSIVVTPRVTLAGSAFHSIQNVTKDEVTRIIPEKCIDH